MGEVLNTLSDLRLDNIIQKWEKLDLIDCVKNKENVSLAFELVSLYLLNGDDVKNHKDCEKVEVVIYPILARILGGVSEKIPYRLISDKVFEITLNLLKVYDETNNSKLIGDDEAMFIIKFCDDNELKFGDIGTDEERIMKVLYNAGANKEQVLNIMGELFFNSDLYSGNEENVTKMLKKQLGEEMYGKIDMFDF